MQKISEYIAVSNLCIVFALLLSNKALAQETKSAIQPKDTVLVVEPTAVQTKNNPPNSTRLWQGLMLTVDAGTMLQAALQNDGVFSTEIGLQANLKRKYFPTIELGWTSVKKETSIGVTTTTNAPFFKIGVNLNLLKQKSTTKWINNYVMAGLRLGGTSFGYTVKGLILSDDYWKSATVLPDKSNTTFKAWAEIIGGIRVNFYHNFYLGWTVRNKILITRKNSSNVSPWYIPGFGKSQNIQWGFNYIIGYKF